MAKVTLTIEDTGLGSVRIISSPKMKEIKKEVETSGTSTPAYDYAAQMINLALKISKMANEEKSAGQIIKPF